MCASGPELWLVTPKPTCKYFSKQRDPPSTTAAPLSPSPTQPCTSSSGWQVLQTNFHLKPTAEVKSSISLLPLPLTMPFPNPYTSSPRVRAWLGSQMRQLERKKRAKHPHNHCPHVCQPPLCHSCEQRCSPCPDPSMGLRTIPTGGGTDPSGC